MKGQLALYVTWGVLILIALAVLAEIAFEGKHFGHLQYAAFWALMTTLAFVTEYVHQRYASGHFSMRAIPDSRIAGLSMGIAAILYQLFRYFV